MRIDHPPSSDPKKDALIDLVSKTSTSTSAILKKLATATMGISLDKIESNLEASKRFIDNIINDAHIAQLKNEVDQPHHIDEKLGGVKFALEILHTSRDINIQQLAESTSTQYGALKAEVAPVSTQFESIKKEVIQLDRRQSALDEKMKTILTDYDQQKISKETLESELKHLEADQHKIFNDVQSLDKTASDILTIQIPDLEAKASKLLRNVSAPLSDQDKSRLEQQQQAVEIIPSAMRKNS